MLTCVYMAATVLATGHLMLFLPRAPLVACQALHYAGLLPICHHLQMPFHQVAPCVMVAWFCLVAGLVASVVAFWLCLVRTYSSSSCDGSSNLSLEMARRGSGPIGDGLAPLYSRLLY